MHFLTEHVLQTINMVQQLNQDWTEGNKTK